MKIGIDCGHTLPGQPGSGAVGFLDESTQTRVIGKEVMKILKNRGCTVMDCTNDYAGSALENLKSIVGTANKAELDLFVSIHFNSGGGRGTEVYTYAGRPFAEAEDVCRNIAELGFINRGIKDGSNLYVIRNTNAKAMLIEVCFVDSDDAKQYIKVGYEKIARAICDAVTDKEDEYTETSEIIGYLYNKKIISDTALWLDYCRADANVYWFCRKLCGYIEAKALKENEQNEYTDIYDIAWDLNYRGIISDIALWEKYMKSDANIYWLLRKSLHYCRTH